jgi:uncharacterized protein (UPF0335 family)
MVIGQSPQCCRVLSQGYLGCKTTACRGRAGGLPVRGTNAEKDAAMSDVLESSTVAADELRQFVERYEQLEAEKKDVAENQKELMAEAKGRGYDTKILRKIVALRKRTADDIAEEESILELYKTALGMA